MKSIFGIATKVVLLLIWLISFQANAASCIGTGYDISNKVAGSLGSDQGYGSNSCQISEYYTNDNPTNPPVVNNEPFFGITNWQFAGKNDGETGSVDIGFSSEDGQEGTWQISSDAFTNYNIMLIFKDGSALKIVGYLLNGVTPDMCSAGVCSGDWDSPFVEPPFDFPGESPKDTSHISAYVSAIPIPATVWLFGSGLLGFVMLARRKKSV